MTPDDVSSLETLTVADISNVAFFPPEFYESVWEE